MTQLQNKAAPVLAAGRGPLSGAKPVVAGGGHKAATLENEGWGADGERSEPLASTLLVAPHLHPFNAAQFDNFARSLAIALKQTPIMDRIEIEARCVDSQYRFGCVVLVSPGRRVGLASRPVVITARGLSCCRSGVWSLGGIQ